MENMIKSELMMKNNTETSNGNCSRSSQVADRDGLRDARCRESRRIARPSFSTASHRLDPAARHALLAGVQRCGASAVGSAQTPEGVRRRGLPGCGGQEAGCGRRHRDRGEGVISTAIAVLIVAFLGAAMWVAFNSIWGTAETNIKTQVEIIGTTSTDDGGTN